MGGCVAASLRRLGFAAGVNPIDPALLLIELQRRHLPTGTLRRATRDALGRVPSADWERDVLDALASPRGSDAREALLGEAMTELERRARRWARVPRVAASLASSLGFLVASVAFRIGLAAGSVTDRPPEFAVNAAVLDAVDAVALGFAGSALCVAVQRSARTIVVARMAAANRFVDGFEKLVDAAHGGAPPSRREESTEPFGTGGRA